MNRQSGPAGSAEAHAAADMSTAGGRTTMIAPDLVEFVDGEPRIVVGRSRVDGRLQFPLPAVMDSDRYERACLGTHGRLWSWTVQRFRPKSPPFRGPDAEAFEPFYVGYVEFAEGIVIEGRIDAVVDRDVLRIGAPMVTTVIPILRSATGEAVCVHGFKPVGTDGPTEE